MEEGDPTLQLWPGKPDDGVSGGWGGCSTELSRNVSVR